MSAKQIKGLAERLAELEAENAQLKAKSELKLSLAVSTKGCISLLGLRRFPSAVRMRVDQLVIAELFQCRGV